MLQCLLRFKPIAVKSFRRRKELFVLRPASRAKYSRPAVWPGRDFFLCKRAALIATRLFAGATGLAALAPATMMPLPFLMGCGTIIAYPCHSPHLLSNGKILLRSEPQPPTEKELIQARLRRAFFSLRSRRSPNRSDQLQFG